MLDVRIWRNAKRWWQRRTRLVGFDPVYYLRRYSDLAGLSTLRQAEDHFIAHGAAEGRFRNALVAEEADYERYLVRSDSFDLTAYRALNPDLRAAFVTDRDFVLHYIRHGRAEGRPATFGGRYRGADSPPWEPWLSVSQFSALAEDWLDRPVRSREEAVERFVAEGIERLTPLSFELAFDPVFYRKRGGVGKTGGDAELYNDWLKRGVGAGVPGSEAQFLAPYLGESPIPDSFDWRGYARAARLSERADRCDAIVHLFDRQNDWEKARPYVFGVERLVDQIVRYRLVRKRARQAQGLLENWRAHGGAFTPGLNELEGDVLAALRCDQPALEAWCAAIDTGKATMRAVVEAVKMCHRLGQFDRALSILRAVHHTWQHKVDFEELVAQTIDLLFEQVSANAHALLAGADPDDDVVAFAMSTLMAKGLEDIALAIGELEPAPARFNATPNGHVVMLGNENLRQCTHYRIEQKQEQFRAAAIELRQHAMDDTEDFLKDLAGSRAAIFYRVPATPTIIRAILAARRMGIPTYYEIDDLIFCADSYPEPYASFSGQISVSDYRGLRFGVALFRFALSLCDKAIASTPALLERMLPITRQKTGLLVRNGLDSRNRLSALAGDLLRDDARVRIFYGSGTLAHGADFSTLLVPALARLMDERSDVDLVLVGHVPRAAGLDRHEHRIMRYPVIPTIADFWAVLGACNINVAVLSPGKMADCKSEIKWLEAAVAAIPTVASGTATYREVITEGETGFLVHTTDDWYNALSRLSIDAELRNAVGKKARDAALGNYCLSEAAAIWKQEFSLAARAQPPKFRVLVCNVFFSPQSIGGATRVVEDNVAHIVEECPDLELAVFCSDEGFSEAGRTRTTAFGDCKVFRVAVPSFRGVDNRPFDVTALPAFRDALDQFKPDLVHFHCIQRLTASIVVECIHRGIPYVVTVHDAWWISEHQFLLDDDGVLRLPQADILGEVQKKPEVGDSLVLRRHTLGALLRGAACVTTVSEGFADIYRSAGIETVVIGNGLSDLPQPEPPILSSQRLRLGHIGGRTAHKGADLVEAAFRLGEYKNLALLVIDGRLSRGERIETHWGQTPVTLCGHVPLAQAAELYGRMDVLLAPSCWPESYGLVTREALHFGLWAVASRLGGIGEDIVEGENGFVIEPTRQALADILERFNANPDAFRQGTALRPTLQRSAREQAREIAGLYRHLADHRRS